MDIVNELVMVPIKQIKPYERNARKNDKTVEKLVELLPKVGFNVPLLLDRQNVIVKGHTRWRAAIRLGMKAIPCVYSDNDDETNKLDRIADNKVQEFSLWDTEMLSSELAGLNLSFKFDFGMLDLKFDIPAFAMPAPTVGTPVAAAADNVAASDLDDSEEPEAEMTAADLVDTSEPEYLEVLCDNCGHKLFVKAA